WPFFNLEDVVINCDMLQLGNDDDAPLLKTVAWDNGVRYVVTQGWSAVPQAWFWVEDGSGNSQTITLPQYSKQPDIVLGHGQFPHSSGTSYALAVVYLVEPNPFTQPVTANLYVDVYELTNVGNPSFSVNLVTSQPISLTGFPGIFTENGDTDGNPHIDMWSDANNTVDGHPSLHELAIVWSEGYSPGTITPFTPATPGAVFYTHADLFSMGGFAASITGNTTLLNSTSSGMADVACLTDHNDMGSHKMMEIVYGDDPNAGDLYHAEVNLTLATTTTTLLSNDRPVISRIEAMSQYYGTAISGTKW
ncbi:MAG TPA: hypothetical protein PL009_11985, partial [Flavipsychrobacter sp.]|nr:hypothetical protein [Flavipsychrobacter sp.]